LANWPALHTNPSIAAGVCVILYAKKVKIEISLGHIGSSVKYGFTLAEIFVIVKVPLTNINKYAIFLN